MKKFKKNLENRNKIFNFISNHPGVHQREIIKRFNLSEGTIKYHLSFLRRKEFITSKKQMGYIRFYPSGKIGKIEQELLGIFHQEIPKNILIYLICNFGASVSEISENFEKDNKTINYHFKKLIKLNIIEPAEVRNGLMVTNRYETFYYKRNPHYREKIYRLKNIYIIYYFLYKNQDKILDKGLIKDLMVYLEYIGKEAQPKLCGSRENVIDSVINQAFEIFPHPYHI